MTRIIYLLLAVIIYTPIIQAQSLRSIDGSFNNIFAPEWGSTGDQITRVTSAAFADGISTMAGADRPNPRHISNVIFAQSEVTKDQKNLSDFVWAFGQFIDHDITFISNNPSERLAIEIPEDDQVFVPGGAPIAMSRSLTMSGTGVNGTPRQYANEVTAFLDGSAIYGSDRERASWLRSYVDGKLKMSADGQLPWNTVSGEYSDVVDENAPHMENPNERVFGRKLYVAGDARANENPLLISLHTLFVREHNRLCDVLKEENPDWSDEMLYQIARKWTSAYLQSITYNEWLPAMGVKLPLTAEYREDVNPQISNVFSAAAFRVGHTLINGDLVRVTTENNLPVSETVKLRDVFFNPLQVQLSNGVEPYIRGMGTQVQQKMDCQVIDDVRNFLFGQPGAGGLDLAAININRGRERGLADYNTIRAEVGLPRIKEFSEITNHEEVARQMAELYGSVDNVDAWVGMLAEDYMPDAILGSTLMLIIERQFRNLRDGDRFFYLFDRYFSEDDVSIISETTLHDIIMRNTDIEFMQPEVFVAMPLDQVIAGPEIAAIDLNAVAYPNPVENRLTIKLYSDRDFDAKVAVYDLKGASVHAGDYSILEGDNLITMDLFSQLDAGFYNVVIERDQLARTVLRVFKQ